MYDPAVSIAKTASSEKRNKRLFNNSSGRCESETMGFLVRWLIYVAHDTDLSIYLCRSLLSIVFGRNPAAELNLATGSRILIAGNRLPRKELYLIGFFYLLMILADPDLKNYTR